MAEVVTPAIDLKALLSFLKLYTATTSLSVESNSMVSTRVPLVIVIATTYIISALETKRLELG
jgi:hypothetical protein